MIKKESPVMKEYYNNSVQYSIKVVVDLKHLVKRGKGVG